MQEFRERLAQERHSPAQLGRIQQSIVRGIRERDVLINELLDDGHGVRELARACGLDASQISRIGRRDGKRRRSK